MDLPEIPSLSKLKRLNLAKLQELCGPWSVDTSKKQKKDLVDILDGLRGNPASSTLHQESRDLSPGDTSTVASKAYESPIPEQQPTASYLNQPSDPTNDNEEPDDEHRPYEERPDNEEEGDDNYDSFEENTDDYGFYKENRDEILFENEGKGGKGADFGYPATRRELAGPSGTELQIPTLKAFLENCGLGQDYEKFTAADYSDMDVKVFLKYQDRQIERLAKDLNLSSSKVNRFETGLQYLKQSLAPYTSEEIHRGSKRRLEEDILTEIRDMRAQLESLREDKKASISILRVTQKQFLRFMEERGLVRRTVEFNVPPTSKSVQPFVWDKEDAHSKAYIKWLKDNLTLPGEVDVYRVSSKANLLSTTLASSQFNINGTMDMAIIDKSYIKDRNIASGIRVGIEQKKQVNDRDVMQVILELITANIYSNYPVVMVLTDLGSSWQFFWLTKGEIESCTSNLLQAITLLECIIHESGTTQPPVDIPNAPYRLRCKFREAVKQESQSGGTISESETPVEGLEQLLRRPKVDIMDLLPKDDVADMRDVFDMMTPEEICEWQVKKALDFVIQTPAFQSSVTGANWHAMYS